MSNNGWVLIWREMFEDKLWLAEPFTRGQAWVDLILLANHTPSSFYIRGNEVKVNRGQVARSEMALAERWQWSRGKVRRYIRMLETGQQIVQQKNFLITLITITNYNRYQPKDGKVVQQKSESSTADSTADGTADGTHTKKVKEELKKVKEDIPGKKKPGKDTWITPFCKIWEELQGGDIPMGIALKNLIGPVKKLGTAEVEKAFRIYLQKTDPQYISIPRFASTVKRWTKDEGELNNDKYKNGW